MRTVVQEASVGFSSIQVGCNRKVLNDGFVKLDFIAPDEPELQLVNAARVSFNKRKDVMDTSDEGLIRYLMKHRHGTPFEMVEFCFHIRCPIFVAREWQRHRISSFNEMSGRYTELEQIYYQPEPEAIRCQTGKPGNYSYEPAPKNTACTAEVLIGGAYDACTEAYETLLELGIAKELARTVLPVGIYTEFYYKTNLRSLLNFISLRNDDRALLEIREYAQVIEEVVKAKLPTVHDGFVKGGRVAP
jgi:thymidylate synthase (FAD)